MLLFFYCQRFFAAFTTVVPNRENEFRNMKRTSNVVNYLCYYFYSQVKQLCVSARESWWSVSCCNCYSAVSPSRETCCYSSSRSYRPGLWEMAYLYLKSHNVRLKIHHVFVTIMWFNLEIPFSAAWTITR